MEATTKKFIPKQEVLVVEPVMRSRNALIDDPDHEAYFLYSNAKIEYFLPVDRQNNLVNPFSSKEEQEWLEKELDVDLNIYKKQNNYWHTHKVRLGKDLKKLNLSNPKDYLDYLVLRANPMYIAPDEASRNNRATYRYALVSEGYKVVEKAKKSNLKKEAYKEAAKLEARGNEAMVDFLKVYGKGKNVSPASKTSFLVGLVDDIIEEDIKGFLAVIKDEDTYTLKLLVERACEAGAVNKKSRKYYLPGGDPLCGEGDTPTITNVIKYLQSPANGDIVDLLMARVDAARDNESKD